ncbi:MAG: hypothetical protein ABFS37_08740 [Acidobacteriota bacterium]
MKKTLILTVTLALLIAGAPAFAAEDSQSDQPVPQRYRGRMAALSGPAAGATAYMTFHIDRFATDAETQVLAQTLGEQGEEALLKAITSIDPGGWVKIGNGLRYNLRVIRTMQTPEGRMIVGITDRPIQFGEIARGTRSRQYTFGWVQILFDSEGKGEGGLIPTAKINFNEEGRLVVESFGLQPYRILKVLPEKIKGK